MQNLANPKVQVTQDSFGASLGKPTNGNQPIRLENLSNLSQVSVARFKQRLCLHSRKFVGRTISTTVFHESQWTKIRDKVLIEKGPGRTESLREEAP